MPQRPDNRQPKEGTRWSRLVAVLVSAPLLAGGLTALAPAAAAPAPDGHVLGATVSLSTSLAGATQVTYTIELTTSPTGALSANTGMMDVEGPEGTFPGCATGSVTDLTTNAKSFLLDCGAQLGKLRNHLRFPPSVPVRAGDRVEVLLTGLDNPAALGPHLLKVGTSSDSPVPIVFRTTAPERLTALSLSRSDGVPGATQVTYILDFTASPGAALVLSVGTIDIQAPPGTFPKADCVTGKFTDLTTAASSGLLECGAHVGTLGAEVRFVAPVAVSGGDHVEIVLAGLDNPKTPGPHALTVATSSDEPRTVSYAQAVPAQNLTGVSVIISSPAARATAVTYTVELTTSATGALVAGAGTVTVDAAAGTFPGGAACRTGVVTVTNLESLASGQLDFCSALVKDGGSRLQFVTPVAIGAGQRAELALSGLDNPARPGREVISVSTSSDRAAYASYAITGQSTPIAALSVALSSTAARATRVTYTLRFTPSASGGLAANFSGISIKAPAGTFPVKPLCSVDLATVTDLATETHRQEDLCSATVSSDGSQLQLVTPVAVSGGQQVEVSISGLANPPVPGLETLALSTTSNTARLARYRVIPATPVSQVSVTLSNPTVGAEPVTYAISLTVPPSGAVAAGSGTITVKAGGASLPSAPECGQGDATVTDITSKASAPVTSCFAGPSPGSLGVLIPIAISGGDRAVLTVPGLVNPSTAGPQHLSVATSSSGVPVTADFITRPGASIRGHLGDSSGFAVPGAEVQACPTVGGPCFDAPSGPNGGFYVFVPKGQYTLSAYPPAHGSWAPALAARTVLVKGLSAVTGANITLRVLHPLPGGVRFGGQESGVPELVSFDPTPMAVRGCRHGIGAVTIQGTNVQTGQKTTLAYPLVESPPGSGYYTGTIPPVWPVHGAVTVQYRIHCFGGLLPDAGLSTGGNEVTISGAGFKGARAVMFGAKPARFTVLSATRIEAVAPSGEGTVSVSVRTASEVIRPERASTYSYISISSMSPASGPSSGGTTVGIRGAGLSHLDTLWFGARPASLQLVSDRLALATSPPGTGLAPVGVDEIGQQGPPAAAPGILFHYDNPGVTAPTHGEMAPAAPVASPGPATQYEDDLSQYQKDTDYGYLLGCVIGIAGYFGGLILAETGVGIAVAFGGLILAAWACRTFKHSPTFNSWFDPSGTVFSASGAPLPGATVVLEQAPTPDGPFTAPAATNPGIEPHVNPEVTGASGRFHWDVVADYYRVVASAPGCHAPGDPSQAGVSTPVMVVPPPRFGLELVLQCARSQNPSRPTVLRLSRSDVPQGGGVQVKVDGTGFTPSAKVMFGTTPSPSVTFLSPELLEATAPPERGHVPVVVSTQGGTSPSTPSDAVSYLPLPAVSSVSPASGPRAGGTTVAIRGSGFSGAELVAVGRGLVTGFTVRSPNLIVATLPPGALGAADVSVTTPVGTSAAGHADIYTYARAPWLGAGQIGPRAAVPWSDIGTGWALVAAHGRGASSSQLSLVDPSGGRYQLASSLPPGVRVADWSAVGARALLVSSAVGGAREWAEVDLRSGAVSHRFVGRRAGALYSFGQPTGATLLETWQDASGQFHLSRSTRQGQDVFTFPSVFPGPRQAAPGSPAHFTGTYLQSRDGTQLVMGAALGMAVLSGTGELVRDLYVPSSAACSPLRWWQPGVVLSACSGGTAAAAQYWLVPVSGATPTALARRGVTANVWEAGGALYGRASTSCGTALELTGGRWVPAVLPGLSRGGPAEIIAAEGDQLELVASPGNCGGPTTSPRLLWSDPTTGAVTTLFSVPSGGPATVDAFPYPAPTLRYAEIFLHPGSVK